MIIKEIELADVARQLRCEGVTIQVGRSSYAIRSPLPQVAQAIHFLYQDYPLLAAAAACADYQVSVAPRGGLRRWIKPISWFGFDGAYPLKPLPAAQAVALLEWGMNYCFSSTAHHLLVVHGAALERDGEGLVMPATSGSGKSTLSAGLVMAGWRLLSDEMIVIDPATRQLWPLPRPVSLKNRSIEIIRRLYPNAAVSRPIPNTVKGTVAQLRPPLESIRRMQEPTRLRWVVLPRYGADAATQLVPISQGRAALALINNAFNYSVLGEAGFQAVGALVAGARCFELPFAELSAALALLDPLPGHPDG